MKNRLGYTMIEWIVVVVILGVVCLVLGTSIRKASVAQTCHDAGYPDVRFGGVFAPYGPAYCVKRVNQTDTVVALNKIR